MGCGGSKDSGEGATTIESDMKPVKISKYDDFFSSASTILSNAEDIRGGLQDSKEEMEELSNVHILKEPHLADAIQAWIWCLSANSNGQISDTNLSLEEEAPYVSLDGSNYSVEIISFQNALKTYITTVVESPDKFQEIFDSFKEIADQAPDMGNNLKDDLAGKSPIEIASATAACAKNVATVAAGMKKMTLVKEALQNASKDLPHVMKQVKDMISKADTVGKTAMEQKKLKIADCMEFMTKDKKTAEELKAVKSAKKGKKKGGKKQKGGEKGGHAHGTGAGQHTHGKKEEH